MGLRIDTDCDTAITTFPAALYLGIQYFLRSSTPVVGASAWVFTFLANEAIRTYALHPNFTVAGVNIPTWTTPILTMVVMVFLVPGSSLIGHFCGLLIGYACEWISNTDVLSMTIGTDKIDQLGSIISASLQRPSGSSARPRLFCPSRPYPLTCHLRTVRSRGILSFCLAIRRIVLLLLPL